MRNFPKRKLLLMELGSCYLYVAAGAPPPRNHAEPLHKTEVHDGGSRVSFHSAPFEDSARR